MRRHVPLAQPLPTSRSTPGQAPQHPSPLSGPHSWALGSSPLVPKCYPHFSPSPHRWGRAHACPFAPVLERDQAGDSFSPSPRISTTSAMTWPWSTWRDWSQDSRDPWPGAPTAHSGPGPPSRTDEEDPRPQLCSAAALTGKSPEWALGHPGAPFHCGQGLSAPPWAGCGPRRSLARLQPSPPPWGPAGLLRGLALPGRVTGSELPALGDPGPSPWIASQPLAEMSEAL